MSIYFLQVPLLLDLFLFVLLLVLDRECGASLRTREVTTK